MTNNTHNRRNTRTFTQQLRTTFGRIDPPQAGRKSLLTLGTVCLLITGAASADWNVYDQRVESKLEEISNRIGAEDPRTVNANLDYLNNRFDVKGETYDPDAGGGGGGEGEEEGGNRSKLAEAPQFENNDGISSKRCGGEKTPEAQKTVCEAIVQLEADRYKYLQDMRALSERRAAELKTITDERRGIGEDEYGKLQSNTNRLLAFLAHQRIDDLNLQMAMATFDERIRERREQLNYEGAAALNPRNRTEGAGAGFDWGSLFNGAVQVGTLEAALQVARERDR
jgi:hypothetical protein